MQANGSTMQVCVKLKAGRVKGKKRPLYIAMHGGGGCPKQVNDSQYRQMQNYWFNNTIEAGGIYVATRGITNSWKLHWENNSYACYDRIIENAILLNDVDPNRVYLMGYSAGGDGVYRVTPVMPDRFAAVNMCAGHPNGVSVTNFMHVPTLLQVGECDTAYNRHKIAVQYNQTLQKRRKACGGDGYISECRVRDVRVHRMTHSLERTLTRTPTGTQSCGTQLHQGSR